MPRRNLAALFAAASLAVAGIAGCNSDNNDSATMGSRDRDALLSWSRQLPLGADGRSTGFLTLSSLKGHSLTELRGTAARYGVDWLLLVDGAAAVDRYNNYKAGLLYWTIIGAFVADGTHSDALCVLKATLWDVKTGAALFDEEAEARTKTVGPAALVDDDHEVVQSLVKLARSLGHEVRVAFGGDAALPVAEQFRPQIVHQRMAVA